MVFLLCMVCICLTLRHFSYDSALFGLVSYNDPCYTLCSSLGGSTAYNLRQGIQLVKRLRLLDDRVKQKAEVPREPNSFTPLKTTIDTKHDGLENVSPFKHGVILGSYVRFQGCKWDGHGEAFKHFSM